MQCSQIHKYKVAHTTNKPDPITSQTKSFHILKKINKMLIMGINLSNIIQLIGDFK